MRVVLLIATIALSACKFGGSQDESPTDYYEVCDLQAECFYEAACLEIRLSLDGQTRLGGICTTDCEQDSECPDEGYCRPQSPDAENNVCMKRCETNEDCPKSYGCRPLQDENGAIYRMCVPQCIDDQSGGC